MIAATSFAQNIPEKNILVVGVLDDFPPQYQLNELGEPDGFAIESFDEIAKLAGMNYRYRQLNDWRAMLASLRIGEIDIIPNLGITSERLKDFDFTRPIEKFELGLFVLHTEKQLKNVEDLYDKAIAVVERNAGVKFLERYPQIDRRVYQYAEQALFALIAGDVNGLLYPIPIVKELANRNQVYDKIKLVSSIKVPIERAVAIKKGQKLLLNKLDAAVEQFVRGNRFNEIKLRWNDIDGIVAVDKKKNPQEFPLYINIIIAIVLLVCTALWYFCGHKLRLNNALTGIIIILGGMLFLTLVVLNREDVSEQQRQPIVISVIQLSNVDASTYAGFLVEMKRLGYQQNIDVKYIYKGAAKDIAKLDDMVRWHLTKHPDLILVSSTPGTQAVKRLTKGLNIPVVFAPVNDPLDAGILTDLKSPQDHITGVRLPSGDDLRLQWLRRIDPKANTVFIPYTEGDKSALATIQNIRKVSSQLNFKLITSPLGADDIIYGERSIVPQHTDAIFLPRDSTVEARIKEFVNLSIKRQLPLSVPSAKQVYAGALFSYGFVHFEIGKQAAQLVDQILRGTPPSGLSVLTAENHMIINMKTLQQIQIHVSPEVLHQANLIIR